MLRVVAGLALLAICFGNEAWAQVDFLSSSPGKLSSSHSSLDGQDNCDECHDSSEPLSRDKCLGCHDHENLKKRMAAGKGFHASGRVKGQPCQRCHKEHRGRGFDLMGWESVGGIGKFNHSETGWPLQAKHKVIECKECHDSTNRQGLRLFMSKSKGCADCHEKEQPHGPVRKGLKKCERCHSQSAWKPPLSTMKFDHNRNSDADMPLEGTHADVACSKCHAKAKFKLGGEAAQCQGCHKSPHDGQLFGTKDCSWCHSPKQRSLRMVQFAHKKRTGYPLLGKHGKLNCTKCHTKSLGKRKPTAGCAKCHGADSGHKGRFKQFGSPPQCETCHQQGGWRGQVFNHGKNTEFALTGKHQRVKCRSCHRGKKSWQFERFDMAKNGCMGCHEHKKAHGGKYQNSECLNCHTQPGAKRMTKKSLEIIHGAKARFPLTLRHAKIKCDRCHVNDVYERMPRECGERCHEDSLHRGRLGDKCMRCHSPGRWDPIRFDHKTDTEYPLRGRHKVVPKCINCHPGARFKDTPRNCGDGGCHKKDDIHQRALGDKCGDCHTETGKTKFQHNRQSKFRIDGAHTLLLCANCHKDRRFKPTPSTCSDCHPEPEVHKGRYGTACADCHSTRGFGSNQETHDVGDFSLKGAHDQLSCKRCHKSGEVRRASGNLCITCHKSDDVHQNGLSPRCGECHTQNAFLPARFNHLQVGCNLPGLHRTLPCADCHLNGNFGGVSPLCVSCHRGDALRVTKPLHINLLECGDCHNTNFFAKPGRNIGIESRLGRQTICR